MFSKTKERIAVFRSQAKMFLIGGATVGIVMAGLSARDGDAESRAEQTRVDVSPGVSDTDTSVNLRRGVTLMNEPGNPQSTCGATKEAYEVQIVGRAEGIGDERWIQIAPRAGSLSVRRAPFDEVCIAQPWANETGIQH